MVFIKDLLNDNITNETDLYKRAELIYKFVQKNYTWNKEFSIFNDVSVKDLLGRESVKPNEVLLSLKIKDKVVLVTGAGGSIGSELCRQIILQKPKRLILFDINEF